MSCNRQHGIWNWKNTEKGDTKPAFTVSIPGRSESLSRAYCKVVDDSGATVLELDSATSGITLNTTAAPTWEFTVDVISAATTDGLTPGNFTQKIKTTSASGVVKTWLEGTWTVTP